MTDKFPEAFERFERKGTVEDRHIETFEELLAAFVMWGQKKATLSRKQTRALAIQAKENGLKKIKVQEMQVKDGKTRNVYRDPITGQYAPKGDTAIVRNTKPPDMVVTVDNTRIEKYGKATKYRDAKTGKFTKKPKGE